jgi:hypothetical protein
MNWRARKSLVVEVLEDRRLMSAQLILSGPQTLAPYANVNVSNSAATGESEMAVAINPTNPLNVVGFSHDYNSSFDKIQVFHSFNGGATWTRNVIGDSHDGLASNFRFDPTVKFDANGNLFIGYCAGVGSGSRLVVGKSTDGGVTFPASNFRIVDTLASGGAAAIDKVYLGTGPAGPGSSNPAIFAGWERNPGATIMVSGSNDGGNTWTAPFSVGGVGYYAGPVSGPNGELYVVWHSINDGLIRMRAKPDGLWGPGAWNPVVTVRTLSMNMLQFSIPPHSRRGIYNTPVIDVDRSGGVNNGRVYVTFVDRVAGANTDVYLSYSDNNGTTWSATGATGNVESGTTSEFHSWVAVDQSSGSVNILYKTNAGSADTSSSTTRVASSFDGGVTFPSKADIASQRSRALSASYVGEFLDYTGFDVHNGTMHGFWADNRGATPGTYVGDLEAYSGKAAFVSTTGANKLVVNGDKGGAALDDRIYLRRSATNADFIEVIVNGAIEYAGLLQSINQIEVNGLNGNNAVVVQDAFTGVTLTINGGISGRNLMIAGMSAATLVGGSGEDILIGGSSIWDTNTTAIDAIMAEWTRTDINYRQRLVHIFRSGGINGSYTLNSFNVTGNSKANVLSGLGSRDVFFVDALDSADIATDWVVGI